MILTSFTPPTEGIVHQQENTCADLQGKDLGKGILYIAESYGLLGGQNGNVSEFWNKEPSRVFILKANNNTCIGLTHRKELVRSLLESMALLPASFTLHHHATLMEWWWSIRLGRLWRRYLGLVKQRHRNSCVSWMSSSGEGFSLQYPSISLHAVSRDLNAYPHECLYVMVDGKLNENEVNNSSDSEEEEEEISDLRFIPEDKGALDAIFQAMSSCQVLHPDEEYSNSEDEIIDEDDYYTSEDALENLTDQGRATLERLEGMLAGQSDVPVVGRTANGDNADNQMETEDNSMETGQFEDADH